ncbi:hypothetical protein GWI33_023319, partial [Rhynchophorus ferrugineus]
HLRYDAFDDSGVPSRYVKAVHIDKEVKTFRLEWVVCARERCMGVIVAFYLPPFADLPG